MNFINHFILIFILVIFTSCSKETLKKSVIKETNLDAQVLEAYKEGLEALNAGDVLFAAKKLMRLKFYSHNLLGHQSLL